MLTGTQGRAALSLVLGTLLGATVLADDEEFAARLKEAREGVVSGAGKDYYEGALTNALHANVEQNLKRLKKCREYSGHTDPDDFDMLLKIAGDGRVEAAMARPESKTATCFLERTQKDVFLRPPAAGFWVEVRINPKIGKKPIDVPVAPPTSPMHLLIAGLSSADPKVRSGAAWQLAGATERRAEALAALEPLEAAADRRVRYATAWALGHLRPPTYLKTTTGYTPPKPKRQLRPQYPQRAFAAKIQGTVLLDVLVGEEGEVAHLEIRQSTPELDAAAVACVRKWTFEPARVNGIPRAFTAHIPVTFRVF